MQCTFKFWGQRIVIVFTQHWQLFLFLFLLLSFTAFLRDEDYCAKILDKEPNNPVFVR